MRRAARAIDPAAQLLSLIDQLYAAALDEERWPDALHAMKNYLGAAAATIFVQDVADQRGIITWSANFDPAWQRLYDQYYCRVNPLMVRSAPDLRSGFIGHDQQYIATEEFVRTEYYSDFFRPAGLKHAMGLCPWREDSITTVISMLRDVKAGPATAREMMRARTLMPHLQRAVSIQRRLGGVQRDRDALQEALEHGTAALFVLDGGGRVLRCSDGARRLVGEADGLTWTPDGLRAANHAENSRLRMLVRDCAQTAAGTGTAAGGPLRVSRPSGARAYAVLVAPLRCASLRDARDPAILVSVTDPEAQLVSDADLLRTVHRLTPAETRLATALLSGASVSEFAECHSVSLSTVRTHLRRLFEKTRTRRQGELVSVLAATSPVRPRQPR